MISSLFFLLVLIFTISSAYTSSLEVECNNDTIFFWDNEIYNYKPSELSCKFMVWNERNEAKYVKVLNQHLNNFKSFSKKTEVKTVWIHHTINIGYPILEQITSIFRNIKNLRMEYTDLDRIDATSGLSPQMIRLYLGRNEIKEVSYNAFQEMMNLELLYLNNNKIQFLSAETFRNLKVVRKIFLNDNLISEIPDNLFTDNNKLEKVYLHNNPIQTIGENSFPDRFKENFLCWSVNKIHQPRDCSKLVST